MKRASFALALLAAAMLSTLGGGCGDRDADLARQRGPQHGAAVLISSAYAPSADLVRLVEQEARRSGVELRLRTDALDTAGQLAQLRRDLAAASNWRSVIVAPLDPVATQRVIAGAGGAQRPLVMSVVEPVRGARSAVRVDEGVVAARLAHAARRWATAHGGVGAATVIAPPATDAVPDWSIGGGRRLAAAVAAQLADGGFAVTTVRALGAADAPAALAGSRAPVVIGWNDVTALAAARIGDGVSRWVAAAGAPAPTSGGALRAVRRGELALIVGTRLRVLAERIVDAARTGTAPHATLPVEQFTAAAVATRRALADYASEP
ncbi:MAG: hypothetical protein QM679_11740 [Patulibacter sp.]